MIVASSRLSLWSCEKGEGRARQGESESIGYSPSGVSGVSRASGASKELWGSAERAEWVKGIEGVKRVGISRQWDQV